MPTGHQEIAVRSRPAQARSRRIAYFTISCLALLILIASILLLSQDLLVLAGILPELPTAGVIEGTPIHWTELARFSNRRYTPFSLSRTDFVRNNLLAADLDGDGVDELITWGIPGATDFATIHKLDHSTQAYKLNGKQRHSCLSALDINGDGCAELGFSDFSGPVEFCDLQGNVLLTLPGVLAGYGNYDDDDKLDILTFDPPVQGCQDYRSLTAFNAQGRVIWNYNASQALPFSVIGDVDGDGLDELIFENINSGLDAAGPNYTPGTITGSFGHPFSVTCATDVNNDNVDEIFHLTNGYLDPMTGEYTGFHFPDRTYPNVIGLWGNRVAVFNSGDRDEPEIAMTTCFPARYYGSGESTAIYIFDLNGRMTYQEEFGEPVLDIAVADDQGHERLAVLTANRLLVSP